MNVAALQLTVDNVIRKYTPQDRTIYKRIVSPSGGDATIGRATFTTTDTVFDPQPIYGRLTRYPVGPAAKGEFVVDNSQADSASSYACTFSSTALSWADLHNENLYIVFVDSAGNEEVFRITDYIPTGLQGQAVIYTTYIESTER